MVLFLRLKEIDWRTNAVRQSASNGLRPRQELTCRLGTAIVLALPAAHPSLIRLVNAGESHCVPLGPLAGRIVVSSSIRFVEVGNLGHKRIIRVGVGQQGADGEEDLGDGESG